MQTQYNRRGENYASSELGKAIVSRGRIPELEAKLFNDGDAKIEEYERLEAELEHADKQLKKLALENLAGLKGLFYEVLDKIGIYPVDKLLEKRGRELLAMKSRLEVLVKSYESERKRLDEEFKDVRDKFVAARNLLHDYDVLLEGLEEETEKMKRDYLSLVSKKRGQESGQEQDREKMDEVDIAQIKYDLEDQIAKIQSDIENYKEKKESVCGRIVEYSEALKVYRRRREVLNIIKSKLYERINALRILYERLRLIVRNGNTNLRKAIAELKMSEGLVRTYVKIANEAEEVETRFVESLSKLDVSTSPGSSAKVEKASYKRQSAMEEKARKIIEAEEGGLLGLT
ncbi:hypothetical protein KY307_01525 [Candidatus Woesearchaeota archaeon]|nr:hypothetical protein [Candidatus Woesearchaeota archaeon]